MYRGQIIFLNFRLQPLYQRTLSRLLPSRNTRDKISAGQSTHTTSSTDRRAPRLILINSTQTVIAPSIYNIQYIDSLDGGDTNRKLCLASLKRGRLVPEMHHTLTLAGAAQGSYFDVVFVADVPYIFCTLSHALERPKRGNQGFLLPRQNRLTFCLSSLQNRLTQSWIETAWS